MLLRFDRLLRTIRRRNHRRYRALHATSSIWARQLNAMQDLQPTTVECYAQYSKTSPDTSCQYNRPWDITIDSCISHRPRLILVAGCLRLRLVFARFNRNTSADTIEEISTSDPDLGFRQPNICSCPSCHIQSSTSHQYYKLKKKQIKSSWASVREAWSLWEH